MCGETGKVAVGFGVREDVGVKARGVGDGEEEGVEAAEGGEGLRGCEGVEGYG